MRCSWHWPAYLVLIGKAARPFVILTVYAPPKPGKQSDLLRQAELDLKEYEAFPWHDEVNSLQGLQ